MTYGSETRPLQIDVGLNHESGSSYMDILVSRTLYICLVRPDRE